MQFLDIQMSLVKYLHQQISNKAPNLEIIKHFHSYKCGQNMGKSSFPAVLGITDN